ncbi:hypothetical protein MB14_09395 [Roseivirga ehrenbergii]|uniref:Uncharacterized protein n=1 Tax=Roseivirga ehrenbergii (strain DSM 102268 / JCM 13514 / KCTC 12282 / NCIMB 14502 / KMM 6017) TaxID=279360 RepID=A0A150X0I2_ROSEK|nr:hypothetical protein MB14_09395 [Roseivirga ehrenbergii]
MTSEYGKRAFLLVVGDERDRIINPHNTNDNAVLNFMVGPKSTTFNSVGFSMYQPRITSSAIEIITSAMTFILFA